MKGLLHNPRRLMMRNRNQFKDTLALSTVMPCETYSCRVMFGMAPRGPGSRNSPIPGVAKPKRRHAPDDRVLEELQPGVDEQRLAREEFGGAAPADHRPAEERPIRPIRQRDLRPVRPQDVPPSR